MNRRKFIKRSTMACAAMALMPGRLRAQAEKAAAPASSGTSGTGASGANIRASDVIASLNSISPQDL